MVSPPQLVKDLCDVYGKIAEAKVAWFHSQMPPAYFTENNEAVRLGHLKSLIALEMTGHRQEMTLQSGDTYTFFSPSNAVGLLSRCLKRLPTDKPLREAKIYTSSDASMVIDVFEFGSTAAKYDGNIPPEYQQRISAIAKGASSVADLAEIPNVEQLLRDHLGRCDPGYVLSTAETTILHHFRIVRSLTDGAYVEVSSGASPITGLSPIEINQASLLVVIKPAEFNDNFSRIVGYLTRLEVDVIKAKLVRIRLPDESGDAFIATLFIRHADGSPIHPLSRIAVDIRESIKRIVYLDENVISFFDAHKGWTLGDSEVLLCLCSLAHLLLAQDKPLVFTQEHITSFVEQHEDLARSIVRLLLERFNPGDSKFRAADAFDAQVQALRGRIESLVELDDHKVFFHTVVNILVGARKFNFYLANRRALALRMDAGAFSRGSFAKSDPPFAVFFVCGRRFVGFHVRFRDVARGGVRLVIPRSAEQHAVASRGLFAECYGLASAQQAKNKDIPEGGSKAVVLVDGGPANASSSAKAFTDCLLDLTIAAVENPLIVDFTGHPEIVYLGPDENITNYHISWISDRAAERGHPFPSTFMSSKPGAGINHKAYGVTSEGLTVYLDIALRHIGIDPKKEAFSLKMTGGPDGDVAGNEIKILHREYGANCKIVAIGDGFGVAEDPDGLDHGELLRLVKEGSSIVMFDKKLLGPNGKLVSAEGEGAKARNTMPFRVRSDVFVPAGGRPHTINGENWHQFLDAEGRPVSRLIVEGANIFLTTEARKRLSDKGVVIIKDSSANKGGVITSSYEILAGMLLNEKEFLQIKEEFVKNALDRLRLLAKLESEALLRERSLDASQTLPEISASLSSAINLASDKVHDRLASRAGSSALEDDPVYGPRIFEYIPPSIYALLGQDEVRRRIGKLPVSYKQCVLAKSLGSLLVYTEGIAFLKGHLRDIAAAAEIYLGESARVRALLEKLKETGGPLDAETRAHVVAILEKGGARVALEMKM